MPTAWLGKEPTMVIGADVTHFPKDGGKPSIAAMVGSLDNKFVQYASSLKFQSHVTETLEFAGDMFTELLKEYGTKNKKLPSRIVFYRDGVASSQFGMVLGVELKELKKAALKLKPGYNPKITYIILQKRHHMRLFAHDPRDADKSGNCKSGLVVDSDITHPYENDFYLMSQAGLKGTSKPSRYIILRDENAFTPDEIQTFTYHQCFTFGRATKAVSCVPAVYYSHLLAFRGRHMLVEKDDNASVSSGGRGVPKYQYFKFNPANMKEMFYV
jgi:eukaryotic translation initiation factor 2C